MDCPEEPSDQITGKRSSTHCTPGTFGKDMELLDTGLETV